MNATEIENIIQAQKAYFFAGNTLNVKQRKKYLLALKAEIRANIDKIASALQTDLGKSASESYMCETGLTLSELTYQIKHIKKFCKNQKVKTPVAQWIAKSYRLPSPYGTVLIMSPWNYPFLLSLEPLVNAIAAGNTVVLKPSAYSPATTDVVAEIIAKVFPPELVSVVKGGRAENACLLDADFDYIFFTGSKTVGKLVYEKAASRMTPVTLELGGKSPCIVDETAKIPLAAKRIVFGKYLNCGQTCVAPDYILCHESVKDAFIAEVKKQIVKQFGENPLQNPAYGKMISAKHFERVCGLINPAKVVHGGQADETTFQIAPTVLDGVTNSDA
ncbi:MAG: aldehyde dehydrogenase family protein, partial [Clostridiales bacterium]|nr:aldehyde dehydrogenase family protein [Clostridiales bacterium]